MAAKNNNKSRVSKSGIGNRSTHFFQKWMAGVLVAVIAIVGILVVWRSFASPLPQDVINNVHVEVLPDGRAKVTESSLGYEHIFNQIDTARAISDQNYYNELMQKVLDELQKLYDKKHPDNAQPTPNPTPTPSPSPTPSPTPNPIQPVPSQPSGSNTSNSNGGGSGSDQNGVTKQPSANANPGKNITSSNKTQESLSGSYYDVQNPETLPTLSGTVDFTFNPPTDSRANVVGVYVDNKLNQYFDPKTNKFSIDTTRLSNGQHRIDVLIYDKDQKELSRYVYSFNVDNKLNFFHSLFNTVSQPFVSLFSA